ncbi:hypothetical protein [Enterobacter quasiroggenkampii]|uniref:hypothetical protein n=1 Tax=Enterobacter quasiroggenkampii TaxID=2497436 RepID=UPI0021D15C4A|nr:hypothetical protein [Enterobacter quasiroggenkampii]MCU6278845.1 hypothetical protein [Enterobacter quasiroggenkampii]
MTQIIEINDANLDQQLPVDDKKNAGIDILARCNTGQSGCAGLARFGGFNETRSFRVYFGNGTEGNSSAFVLQAGQYHELHVKSGDTFAWVYGNTNVPPGTQRYYILVE